VVTNRETINKSVHLNKLVKLKMVGHIRAVRFGNRTHIWNHAILFYTVL